MSNQWANDAWGYKGSVSMSSELQRILKLRRRALELDGTDRAETLMDMETERYRRPVVPGARCRCAELDPERHEEDGCITRMRLPQAQATRETRICGGLFAPIGVGWGKTLIDLLLPFSFREHNAKLTEFVLLVPPKLAEQLEGDYRYYGQHFRMPQIVFHGNCSYSNTVQRMDPYVVLERDAPVLHVVPYSQLSRPESTDWLTNELKPHAIIADEGQRLRNCAPPKASATGARVWRYMEDVAPWTHFAVLSGSMTAKKLADYWHLAKWALRGASPVPTDQEVMEDWSGAINPSLNPKEAGALELLLKRDADGKICETLYSGFKRRIAETVGVVTTAAPSIDIPLDLEERDAPVIPESVKYNLKMVRGQLKDQAGPQRPDGDELVTALEVHACAMQVACGFYYKFIYPNCEFPRDNELVDRWNLWRKEYAREMRNKLKDPQEHLDSPKLLTMAAERFYGLRPKRRGLPEWKSKAFPEWVKLKHQVVAKQKAVWFDDYLVNDAIAWGREHRGIIWYEHATVGERLATLSGLPNFGAGQEARRLMLGDRKRGIPGEDGSRSVICSVKAHGIGTNGMQYRWAEMLFLNPAASPDGWEQPLGRLHRPGQPAPQVSAWFYRHTDENAKHVDDALRAAYYVEGTGFGSQKIIGKLAEE